jgi:hypothetical protein
MQSVFSVAARRTPYPEFRAGKSRAGALKTLCIIGQSRVTRDA